MKPGGGNPQYVNTHLRAACLYTKAVVRLTNDKEKLGAICRQVVGAVGVLNNFSINGEILESGHDNCREGFISVYAFPCVIAEFAYPPPRMKDWG